MFFRKFLAAAVIAASVPLTAAAATFAPGTYQATDYNGLRSVWTGGPHLVSGTGVSNTWTVGDSSLFSFDGTDAVMRGTATNTGAAGSDLVFDFVLKMTLSPGASPYCRTAICDIADESMWALFTLTSGTFTGAAGSQMADIVYSITQKSPHGPQAGVGANDKDATENGFSMWYYFARVDDTDTATRDYTFNTSGSGDFNMDLASVPLPAGGLLLLGGLAAFAGLRRKSGRV